MKISIVHRRARVLTTAETTGTKPMRAELTSIGTEFTRECVTFDPRVSIAVVQPCAAIALMRGVNGRTEQHGGEEEVGGRLRPP